MIQRFPMFLVGAALVGAALLLAACSGDPEKQKRRYVASGDRYVAEGKRDAAVIQYRNAVRIDPMFGEARLKLADAYAATTEPARAFREYIRAADLMPADRTAQMKAASALLLIGRFEEAKARAEKVLGMNQKDAEALLVRGNALAGLKQFDAAIKEIEEAISLDPSESKRRAVLGSVYFTRGDAKRAEESFQKALELNPNEPRVLLSLGNFYWSIGRRREAEAMLERAHTAAPKDVETNRALATFYASNQQFQQAEPYMKAIASLTDDPGMRLALADYYVTLGRPDEATAYLQPLVGDQTYQAEARARLATIDYAAGRRKEAYAAIDELLGKTPTNVRGRLLKARLLADDSRLDEAMAEVARCLEIDAAAAPAHYIRGVLLEVRGDREGARRAFTEVLRLNPRAVQAQVRLSEINLADGTFDLAVQFASEALKGDPLNDQARITLARALVARRDLSTAEKEVRLLLQRYPKSPAVQSLAGLLASQMGNKVEARAAFDRALTLNPRSPDALAGLLALDAANRQLGESQARLERTIAEAPDDAAVLLVAARAFGMDRQWDKSEQFLKKLLAVDPDNQTAYSMLGSVYISQGKIPEAQREFEEMARRNPTSVSAATMVGTLLHNQNRMEETRTWYERALKIDPNAAVAANNLAWIYSQSPETLDKALALAQAAANRAPDQAEVLDTLGWVHYKKGQYSLALASLKRCADLDPSNPIYNFHLGLAYEKAGQKPAAKAALARALKLRADFEGADEARRVMTSL